MSLSIRDSICRFWLRWFVWHNKHEIDQNCMCLPVHEYYIRLLNEWASLGNLILPRDKLIELSLEAAMTVQQSSASHASANVTSTESLSQLKNTFAYYWLLTIEVPSSKKNNGESNDIDQETDASSSVNETIREYISSINADDLRKVAPFQSIRTQYEQVLRNMPDTKCLEWKEKMNIDETALISLCEQLQKEEQEERKRMEKKERKKRKKAKIQLQQPSS